MLYLRAVLCGLLVLVCPGRCAVPSSTPSPTPAAPHLPYTEGGMRCWGQTLSELQNSFNISLPAMCPKACGDLKVKVVSQEWARVVGGGDKAFKCLRQLPGTRGRLVQDVNWFASRHKDIMIYLGNSSEVVLTWDYLTATQKVCEVMFLVVVVMGVTAAVLGNTLVLVTMLASECTDALWVMRASLAASDLLRAVTVMVLAVHDILTLMTRPCDMNLTPSPSDSGLVMFVGVMFWVTTLVSVQSLAWLSLERVVLCGFPQLSTHLTVRRVTVALVIVWVIAAGFPITLLLLAHGSVNYFDPVTKLTLLLPDGDAEGGAYVVFVVQCGYLIALSFVTVTASVLAVCLFRVRARQEDADAERHTPATFVWRKRRDDQVIHSTLLLMLTTFLLSVPPFLLFFLLQFLLPPSFRNNTHPLHCTFTWLFVLTSSWQWYVYNLRSDFFRRRVARLLLRCACLPERLKKGLRSYTPSDHALSLNWGHSWYNMHAFIKRKSTGVWKSEGVSVEERQDVGN